MWSKPISVTVIGTQEQNWKRWFYVIDILNLYVCDCDSITINNVISKTDFCFLVRVKPLKTHFLHAASNSRALFIND